MSAPPPRRSSARDLLEAALEKPVKSPAKPAEKRPFLGISLSKNLPGKEIIKLCRSLASMLRANINTSDALSYYGANHPSLLITRLTAEIRESLGNGMPVDAAFKKTGRFDEKILSLIRAGADSGQLARAFQSIADRLKKESEFRSRMRKATLLPGIIIFALLLLFVFSQVRVIPQIEDIILDIGQEPDPVSAVLFEISHATRKVWIPVILLLCGSVFSFLFVERVRSAVVFFLMARWRLLRKLVMGMRQLLFIGSLEMLYSNGINLAKSVEIAAGSLKGTPMYEELRSAGRRYIETGLPFSEALRKFTSCDPQVAHLVSIGERSSSLDEQLRLLTIMYEEEVDQVIGDFTQIVNFIVLVMAGLLITLVFGGSFLPIFLMGPKMMSGQGI